MAFERLPAAPANFDFALGTWHVRHRRLKERLAGCAEWVEFSGHMSTYTVLGGYGNVEDNLLDLPDGPYRAVALRSFDPHSGQWSIWWLDGRFPGRLDVPVVGHFDQGVGAFYADDGLNGRPIKVRFLWLTNTPGQPRWEQAFSGDNGATWETNWTMDFFR
ncbi:MAG: DUF1579 domain-containing protein [Herpetosiphonaceae bacterium]|nr:DUF1579 domain-containing protein [Herpetosiphonaceae bacterium]